MILACSIFPAYTSLLVFVSLLYELQPVQIWWPLSPIAKIKNIVVTFNRFLYCLHQVNLVHACRHRLNFIQLSLQNVMFLAARACFILHGVQKDETKSANLFSILIDCLGALLLLPNHLKLRLFLAKLVSVSLENTTLNMRSPKSWFIDILTPSKLFSV